MGDLFLDRVDSVPLDDDEFSFSFNSWASIMVDTVNEDLGDIQDQMNGLRLATYITPKTTAQITALINMNATPVLSVGAMWFDTTIGKLKVLVTAAVPMVSNGVTQTVTSV